MRQATLTQFERNPCKSKIPSHWIKTEDPNTHFELFFNTKNNKVVNSVERVFEHERLIALKRKTENFVDVTLNDSSGEDDRTAVMNTATVSQSSNKTSEDDANSCISTLTDQTKGRLEPTHKSRKKSAPSSVTPDKLRQAQIPELYTQPRLASQSGFLVGIQDPTDKNSNVQNMMHNGKNETIELLEHNADGAGEEGNYI